MEERLRAAEADAQRHAQAQHPGEAIEELIPWSFIAALHHECSLVCLNHKDSGSSVFRDGEGEDSDWI